jgi:CHASE2 domain-containing sensor protein
MHARRISPVRNRASSFIDMTARENGSAPALFRADSWKWNFGLWAAAALWVFCLGHPVETLERRWFDQTLRWRAALGWTPPADPRIVIVGLDDTDLAALPSLEEEYCAAARLIRQVFELGAAAIVFDVIYMRGTATMAEPIREAIAKGAPVVLAEAMRQAPGSEKAPERLRSFPFLPARVTPAGIVNIDVDADGIHRAYSLLHWTGNAFEPSLALVAWLTAQPLSWDADVRQPAPGVADVGPTAFGSNEPLVLLHATALNDLIQDSFMRRAPRWGDALAFLAVPLLGLAMPLCSRKRWLFVLWLLGLAAIFGAGLMMIFYVGVVGATISTAGFGRPQW